MKLDDTLQVCLLALASRYPKHVIDINENVLGLQQLGAEGWTAEGLIELLEHMHPELLQTTASIVIDIQRSEIYLPRYDPAIPVFLIHCRGKIPGCKGDASSRQITSVTGTIVIRS